MTLRHNADVASFAWVHKALINERFGTLASLVPAGYEAYARLLHPPDPAETDGLAWVEGELPDALVRRLLPVLDSHTSSAERCAFALWNGYGSLRGGTAVATLHPSSGPLASDDPTQPPVPSEWLHQDLLITPGREYLVFDGALTEWGHWGLAGPSWLNEHAPSPDLVWPDDRAWFVATDTDLPWTAVGGSQRLLHDLAKIPDWELIPTAREEQNRYYR